MLSISAVTRTITWGRNNQHVLCFIYVFWLGIFCFLGNIISIHTLKLCRFIVLCLQIDIQKSPKSSASFTLLHSIVFLCLYVCHSLIQQLATRTMQPFTCSFSPWNALGNMGRWPCWTYQHQARWDS